MNWVAAAGHAGLFSTADDLAIFARMMLGEGKHQGKSVSAARDASSS